MLIKGSKKPNGKEKRISVRVSEQEYIKFKEKALKKGKTISEYLRDLIQK